MRVWDQVQLIIQCASHSFFEKAVINNFHHLWPNTNIKECFFSSNQNYQAKGQVQAENNTDESLLLGYASYLHLLTSHPWKFASIWKLWLNSYQYLHPRIDIVFRKRPHRSQTHRWQPSKSDIPNRNVEPPSRSSLGYSQNK